MTSVHISESAMDNCQNLLDSYGMICVHCNCCGRYGEDSVHQCRIDTYKRQLQEEREKVDDPYFILDIQKKNIQINIERLLSNIEKEEQAIKENQHEQ